MLEQVDPLPRYLERTAEADFDDPRIQELLDQSGWRDLSEVAKAKAVFEFVRDEIPHSFDVQASVITCSASEVLYHRTGLCYAKSHLAAALLRAMGVPTGFCYQRLVLFEDPADGYSLHGLNAVWLEGRWVRFDARGNKPGVDAQFSLDEEHLAFSVRESLNETDFPGIYADANPNVLSALRTATNAQTLYSTGLPTDL